MDKFQKVGEDFFVSAQIKASDLKSIKEMGFTTIINNKADDIDTHQTVEQAAKDLGLKYHYVPIQGFPSQENILVLNKILESVSYPVLAFCRSGARSAQLYVMAQQKLAA